MLIEQIKTDMISAKKSGEKIKANLLNTLYAEAVKVGKDKENRLSTDDEVIAVIKKFMKGIDEILEIASKVPNMDTEFSRQEKAILEFYLPKQLVREQLEDIISEQHHLGKNMGEIMKFLKENYSGRYDGKIASEICKKL